MPCCPATEGLCAQIAQQWCLLLANKHKHCLLGCTPCASACHLASLFSVVAVTLASRECQRASCCSRIESKFLADRNLTITLRLECTALQIQHVQALARAVAMAVAAGDPCAALLPIFMSSDGAIHVAVLDSCLQLCNVQLYHVLAGPLAMLREAVPVLPPQAA